MVAGDLNPASLIPGMGSVLKATLQDRFAGWGLGHPPQHKEVMTEYKGQKEREQRDRRTGETPERKDPTGGGVGVVCV